jgi:protein TonB
MRVVDPVLAKALALSLALHALVLVAGDWLDLAAGRPVAAHMAQMDVTLQLREALDELQPLLLPEEPPQPAMRPREPAPPAGHREHAPRAAFAAGAAPSPEDEAMRRANAQLARELLYPPEAIARGLEGQVLVLLFLDASGNPVAARVEASSGHALLDDAAVRAARTLRALPKGVPREALLPVRFSLY